MDAADHTARHWSRKSKSKSVGGKKQQGQMKKPNQHEKRWTVMNT